MKEFFVLIVLNKFKNKIFYVLLNVKVLIKSFNLKKRVRELENYLVKLNLDVHMGAVMRFMNLRKQSNIYKIVEIFQKNVFKAVINIWIHG